MIFSCSMLFILFLFLFIVFGLPNNLVCYLFVFGKYEDDYVIVFNVVKWDDWVLLPFYSSTLLFIPLIYYRFIIAKWNLFSWFPDLLTSLSALLALTLFKLLNGYIKGFSKGIFIPDVDNIDFMLKIKFAIVIFFSTLFMALTLSFRYTKNYSRSQLIFILDALERVSDASSGKISIGQGIRFNIFSWIPYCFYFVLWYTVWRNDLSIREKFSTYGTWKQSCPIDDLTIDHLFGFFDSGPPYHCPHDPSEHRNGRPFSTTSISGYKTHWRSQHATKNSNYMTQVDLSKPLLMLNIFTLLSLRLYFSCHILIEKIWHGDSGDC